MWTHRMMALGLALAATPALSQQILLNQPPESPAQAVISADEPGGDYSYDDQRVGQVITMAQDADLESIRFWGGSETQFGADSNTLGFVVRVYEVSEDGSAPVVIASRRIGRAFATPTQTEETFGSLGAAMFGYEITIDQNPIPLVGGATYIVSVASISFVPPRAGRESWAWASSATGGDVAVDLFDGLGMVLMPMGVDGLALELLGQSAEPPCIADVNGDGALNGLDFNAWIAAYNTGDPRADQNQDGSIDPTDFSAWLANFRAGC